MRTPIAIGAAGLVLTVGSIAPAAQPSASMAPRPVLVKAHGLTARSTVGSYCTTSRPRHGRQTGICVDGIFPKPRGHLLVDAGDTIHLRFRHNPEILDRVSRVQVALVSSGGDQVSYVGDAKHERQVPGHPNRWLADLPGNLHHADALDVFARYRQGDADFAAGIHAR